jgi:hypothetical protein
VLLESMAHSQGQPTSQNLLNKKIDAYWWFIPLHGYHFRLIE